MRAYVPDSNGAVQYLKDMKQDQSGANILTEEGDISDGQLITISKQAFLMSGHKSVESQTSTPNGQSRMQHTN